MCAWKLKEHFFIIRRYLREWIVIEDFEAYKNE